MVYISLCLTFVPARPDPVQDKNGEGHGVQWTGKHLGEGIYVRQHFEGLRPDFWRDTMPEQPKDDDRVIVRLRPQERARMDFMADYLFRTERIPKQNTSEMLRYALGYTFAGVCQETGQDLTQVEPGLVSEDTNPEAAPADRDVEVVIQKDRLDIKEDFSDKIGAPEPPKEDMDKTIYEEDTDFFMDGGKVDPENKDAPKMPKAPKPPKKTPASGKSGKKAPSKGKGSKGSGKGG